MEVPAVELVVQGATENDTNEVRSEDSHNSEVRGEASHANQAARTAVAAPATAKHLSMFLLFALFVTSHSHLTLHFLQSRYTSSFGILSAPFVGEHQQGESSTQQ